VLTKQKVVLEFLWRLDERVVYGDEEHRYWYMTPDVWEDMGKPEKITVTITPGDEPNP
jgi:hypothetical protein